MGTKISWADETWSPIVGCSKVSAGCANCYAEKMANRLSYMEIARVKPGDQMPYSNVIKGKGQWSGDTVFVESVLTKPLHWRKPRKIFVVSMGDLFHESVPFEWVDKIFGIIMQCPQHKFLVLTKRSVRMKQYFDVVKESQARCGEPSPFPLPNVHLGVTVENQDNVGRIADLVRTPAAKRFVSFEPLLGNIYLPSEILDGIDYAFVGCESKGPESRLCSLHDIRRVLDQCEFGNVKNHVKQIPLKGKCNKNFNEWPLEFQIREV